ncbi:hypothetical protein [Shimia aestuarii]|uniref:hypothetical protein n=1 Tax=Shimia aestuarii TaxID=254406 RepID=UPI001FB30B46|nr:hypothetical protein [Shimia aestuarii]
MAQIAFSFLATSSVLLRCGDEYLVATDFGRQKTFSFSGTRLVFSITRPQIAKKQPVGVFDFSQAHHLVRTSAPNPQITEVLRFLLTFSQHDLPGKEPSHATLRGNTMAFTRLIASIFGESPRDFRGAIPRDRTTESWAGNWGMSSTAIDTLFILKSRMPTAGEAIGRV